ncbi:aminoglycoside phosphotransferase family protein [Candidatus Woesebacteria bacterium]|nr:aminoglycoside phosphotransferase family protein [Candidatus Woesebacteria bacterium]
MNLQKSDQTTIENERKLVTKLVNCTNEDIELNTVGWTSRVYIVDKGTYVFKFPRTEKVKKEYEQEIRILKLLENIGCSIQIPKIRWVGDKYDYLGYEGVAGQTIDLVIDRLSPTEKTNIGQQVGKFLIQLHAVELVGAPTITIQDEILQFQKSYQAAALAFADRFTSDEQAKLKTLVYETMPATISELGSDLALCHGDLGYWNLILNDQNKVGAIDFGDIGYYDKSKDFLGMEDKEMLNAALAVYGDNDILRQKIAFRQRLVPLLDLAYFIENNNEQRTAQTIEKIRAAL